MTEFAVNRRVLLQIGASVPLSGMLNAAHATETIRFVVPFPAGGTTDNLARIIAASISTAGQQVVVDNKPGANGIIAIQTVLQAPQDGRTLLFTAPSPVAGNVALYRNLPYDPLRDLVPVARLLRTHMLLVTSADGPHLTFTGLKAASRSGNQITFGAASTGYTLIFEHIRRHAGIDAIPVNYKGTVAALQDVAAGRVDIAVTDPTAGYPLIRAGKLRVLAVLDEHRDDKVPQAPTSKEAGAGDPIFFQWLAVFARSGTPQNVLDRMREQLAAAIRNPAVIEQAKQSSAVPFWGDAQSVQSAQTSEIERYRQLMRSAGVDQQ